MKADAYRCDGPDCTVQAVSAPTDTRPDGWVVMYGPTARLRSSSWHFCGWSCARAALRDCDREGTPLLALERAGR